MEQENNKLKIYKFEATRLKKNEDGTAVILTTEV